MKRFTLSEIQSMPTICQGHDANLKWEGTDNDGRRTKVWLSRLTAEDGQPYDNQVVVEKPHRIDGRWYPVDFYQPVDEVVMRKVTLTFNLPNDAYGDNVLADLRTAWLEDEGVTISTGNFDIPVDLTRVVDNS